MRVWVSLLLHLVWCVCVSLCIDDPLYPAQWHLHKAPRFSTWVEVRSGSPWRWWVSHLSWIGRVGIGIHRQTRPHRSRRSSSQCVQPWSSPLFLSLSFSLFLSSFPVLMSKKLNLFPLSCRCVALQCVALFHRIQSRVRTHGRGESCGWVRLLVSADPAILMSHSAITTIAGMPDNHYCGVGVTLKCVSRCILLLWFRWFLFFHTATLSILSLASIDISREGSFSSSNSSACSLFSLFFSCRIRMLVISLRSWRHRTPHEAFGFHWCLLHFVISLRPGDIPPRIPPSLSFLLVKFPHLLIQFFEGGDQRHDGQLGREVQEGI